MWEVTFVSWTNIEVHNFRKSVWLDLAVHDTNNYRNELISCVKMKINFMCPTGWFMEYLKNLVKHYLWVCLWKCSLVLLFVDWIKQMALPHVCGPVATSWSLGRMKRQRKVLWLISWDVNLPLPSVLFLRLRLRLKSTPLTLLPSSLPTRPSALLGLQLADRNWEKHSFQDCLT